MDNPQSGRVWLCRIPRPLYWTLIIAVFWFPVYESLHQGQITLPLTALLAVGMGRSAFIRGLVVALATAIKPTFCVIMPFLPLIFGHRAVYGAMLGIIPAFLPPEWFMDYLTNLPRIMGHEYSQPSLAGVIGMGPSIIIACVINLLIVWKIKDQEAAYTLVIAVSSSATALWIHSHTPAILAVIYLLNRYAPYEKIEAESDSESNESKTLTG